MRMGKFVPALVCVAAMSLGCSPRSRIYHTDRYYPTPEPVAVTVRFVAPPDSGQFASAGFESADARLVRDGSGKMVSGGFAPDGPNNLPMSSHVVLWGGPYNGHEVTYRPARLTAGPYMFGMFDPSAGAAYQGWLAVNNGGDEVISALNEWRQTAREQQQWLGYDFKMTGKYESPNHWHFNRFAQEIRNLRALEAKIENAILAEMHYQRTKRNQWNQVLAGAEVLLMPGQGGFFSPSTKPAFSEEELTKLQGGNALTKVVLVGNFEQSYEKLNRILDFQDDLYRSRAVLAEEALRLQNRGNWYRLTDHLNRNQWNTWTSGWDGMRAADEQGQWFVQNERRYQQVCSLIAKIDRQIEDHRRHCHALLFVTGLFAPDETFDAFERQAAALGRERVVLSEQKKQLDWKYQNSTENSNRRIALERQRQNVIAEMDKIDHQVGKIKETRVAVNKLRQNTDVIHRHGPAQVLAATFIGEDIPAMFVNAVEQESLMTVRLQSADDMYTPGKSFTKVRSTVIDEDYWRGPMYPNQK